MMIKYKRKIKPMKNKKPSRKQGNKKQRNTNTRLYGRQDRAVASEEAQAACAPPLCLANVDIDNSLVSGARAWIDSCNGDESMRILLELVLPFMKPKSNGKNGSLSKSL
jgi:hypothetical protein